jgi:alanine--tRNA ligase
MTSTQIRQSFLDFFKSKSHTIVPSSSLMPDSPNLLFTNAGMNQFVPIFLGQTQCPYTPGRAADTQKCIRAGGKHNDLDDVGLDTYHHTFFEMLGNWSFGDYFKAEAITWAWELVVEKWKFPPERLYATVYSPDKSKNDPSEFDQEAWNFWAGKFRSVGLDPARHIVSGNKKDNFWMMGETGPCGPCSELHVDLTPEGNTQGSLVNKGDARCIEIWNLVFIQFNANPNGTFSPLPARHVDTGMGFERVTSIIQGTKGLKDFANAKISNYETDIFRPIFDALEKLSGKKYGSTLPSMGVNASTNEGSPTRAEDSRGEHAPSRVPDRALAVGDDARLRASSSGAAQPKYSRRKLPHFERPWAKYMVTFSTREHRKLTSPERDLVLKSILHAHEHRQYELYAACVMPDYVHLLFEPQIKEQGRDGQPVFWPLSEILQGIKSASAHNINKVLGQTGHVWEQESMDRLIRGQSDLEEKFHYICRNPWDADVVALTEDYPWLWTAGHWEPRAEARVGAVDEASTAAREARALPKAARVETTLPEMAPLKTSGEFPSNIIDVPAVERLGEPTCADETSKTANIEQIQIDIAFRVIADHIRTLSFAIADGIQPGVKGRNGVLRSIHKRMARFASNVGIKDDLLLKAQDALVDTLVSTMGDIFPEVRAQSKHIKEVLRQEANVFSKTLERGIEIFENHVAAAKVLWEGRDIQGQKQPPTIFGEWAFQLYDTYGFPLDLTELLARERGLTVDKEGFDKLMEEQKKRSQEARITQVISLSQVETTTPTKFVGYDHLAVEAKVLEVVSLKDKTAVILDTSACYAEMGGQVGDTAQLYVAADVSPRQTPAEISAALSRAQPRWKVVNTQKSGNTWLHFLDGDESPAAGSEVILEVDHPRRSAIERHHTVTHLLHWALHEVASKEASQKGSFVGPDKLTFDFNSAPLTPAQVADIEKLVNERIVENAPVSWTEVKHKHVKDRKDVMQFFGDKYGEWVRVVQIGGKPTALDGYSMELCGGTHTRATGEIGLFRIVGESAIAAGVRRIEAVAGLEAYGLANSQLQLIRSLAGKINSPVHELEKKVDLLLAHQKELEKSLKAAVQRNAAHTAGELLGQAQDVNGVPLITHVFPGADADYLQAVVDAVKGRFKGVMVVGGTAGGTVALIASVSPEFTAKVQAGKIIQAIAPIVGGKGGGKPDNARGGGKDAGKLDEALAKVRSLV